MKKPNIFKIVSMLLSVIFIVQTAMADVVRVSRPENNSATPETLAPPSKTDDVLLAVSIQDVENLSDKTLSETTASFDRLLTIPGWQEVFPPLYESLYQHKKLTLNMEKALAKILARNDERSGALRKVLTDVAYSDRLPAYKAGELIAGAYQSWRFTGKKSMPALKPLELGALQPLIEKFGYQPWLILFENRSLEITGLYIDAVINARKSFGEEFDQYWPAVVKVCQRLSPLGVLVFIDMLALMRKEFKQLDQSMFQHWDKVAALAQTIEAVSAFDDKNVLSQESNPEQLAHQLTTLIKTPGWKHVVPLYIARRMGHDKINEEYARRLARGLGIKNNATREIKTLLHAWSLGGQPSAVAAGLLSAGGYAYDPFSQEEDTAENKVASDDDLSEWIDSFSSLTSAFGYRPWQQLDESGVIDSGGVFFDVLKATQESIGKQFDQLWPDIVRICCKVKDAEAAVLFLKDIGELDKALRDRGESLLICWDDLMKLCSNTKSVKNRVVKECFIPLIKTFRENFQYYLPALTEMNKEAGGDGVLIMRYGLPALMHMIRDRDDILKIGSILHGLAEKFGKRRDLFFKFALPSVKQLINSKEELLDSGVALAELWNKADKKDAPYIFEFGLPAVREMIRSVADIRRLGDDLIALADLAGNRVAELFEGEMAYVEIEKEQPGVITKAATGAPEIVKEAAVGATRIRPFPAFDYDFGPLRERRHYRLPFPAEGEWEFGKQQVRYFSMGLGLSMGLYQRLEQRLELRQEIKIELSQSLSLGDMPRFRERRTAGLLEIRKIFGKDLGICWPGFMDLCKASGSGVVDLVNKGLPSLYNLYGSEISVIWPGIVRLGEKAGANAATLFTDSFVKCFSRIPYPLCKGLILNDQLTDILYEFMKRSGRNIGQNAQLIVNADPKILRQRLLSMNRFMDYFNTDIVLEPIFNEFLTATDEKRKEWAEAKTNWTFNLDDPVHMYLNYMQYNDSFNTSNEGRQVSFEEFVKFAEELRAQKHVKIPVEHTIELRGLAYEAYLVWMKIKEIEQRAKELNRPVIVVGNLSTGKISADPFTVKKDGREVVYGTDIPVIYTKVGSTPCHNDELYLLDDLFDNETLKKFCTEKPIVIVLDASTSVGDPDRTSPHIPDAFKGYRNFFIGINAAQKMDFQGEDFYVDEDFVEVFSHSDRFLAMRKMLKSLGIPDEKIDKAPYRMRVWHPCKKDLWMRVGKAKNMVAPKLKDMKEEITGPTMVFIETAIEPEAVSADIRANFIKGTHSSGFFDDTHGMQRFYWGYMQGRGIVHTDIYDLAARSHFQELIQRAAIRPAEPSPAPAGVEKIDVCPINTVAVDLDGTIAGTDKPLNEPMLGTIIRLLSQNTRVVVLTADIEEHLAARIIDLIPKKLLRNLVIYSEGGARGYTFDRNGGKQYLEKYNNAGLISAQMRRKIEGILQDNFGGEYELDTRPERISPDCRIDLRNVTGSREEFIKKLLPVLRKEGIPAKAYIVGGGSIKILLQSKDDALRSIVAAEKVDPQELLVVGNDARTNRWDRDMLAAFPDAINVNVGKRAQTIGDQNPNIVQMESGVAGSENLLALIASNRGLPIAELQPYLEDITGSTGQDHILRTGVKKVAIKKGKKTPKSFEGVADTPELKRLMAERFDVKQYGLLNDPQGMTDQGDLETDKDLWAAVQKLFEDALAITPHRDGIKNNLRIVAMDDFPIAGHHGTGGKGVGINSAYIDWNVLKRMAAEKEAYAAYFASWLEHEYRERCLGEAHEALAAADALYKDTFAFIKTVLHDNLKEKFALLFQQDPAYASFSYLLANPAFVKERKEILAFSADLFAEAQTFAELEVILAELKLAGGAAEVWIRVADPAEREKFNQLEKSYPFLKVLDQNEYLARLQKAKEKVIKAAFIDDKTMGDLDIPVPKPGAGQAVNAFSVFLAALSKDENIIKTVDKATMAEMLKYIEQTNYGSPVKADYRGKMEDYKNSAIALISA